MGDCFKFLWPFHNVQTLKTFSQQISYELRSIEIVPSDKGHHDTPLSLQKLIVNKQISMVLDQQNSAIRISLLYRVYHIEMVETKWL